MSKILRKIGKKKKELLGIGGEKKQNRLRPTCVCPVRVATVFNLFHARTS